MAIAVDVSDFVQTSVNISPLAIPYGNFGLPIIAGDSDVIDVGERYRIYSGLTGVAQDFGTTAPEYLSATVYFGQLPQPNSLMIGRWARTATKGKLKAQSLTATQQLITNFNAIADGSFTISIDGVAKNVSPIDFTATGAGGVAVTNLNGVATRIATALNSLSTGSSCVWNATYMRFEITSGSTGTGSTISFGTAYKAGGPPAVQVGTDISGLLKILSTDGGVTVAGIAAETALAGATALAAINNQWYGLTFAASTMPVAADYEAVAAMILASQRPRIFGVTIQTTDCLDPSNTSDLASVLKSFNNRRCFWYYDPINPYAVITMMGRAFTVNFAGSFTTITLAYKQAPGLSGVNLTETQFATLQAKGGNCNVIVDNGAVMIWPGQMSTGEFFDEVHGLDWQANDIQVNVFNLLYQSQTKIPQTDAGNHLVATVIENSCEAGVNNGLCAGGQWNGPAIGTLQTGDTLSKGYMVYYPPIATQAQADREARKSVPFQIAYKLAGAIHTVDVIINVNR